MKSSLRSAKQPVLVSAALVVALSAGLAGCGKKEKEEAAPAAPTASAEVTGDVKPAADKASWMTHKASGTKFMAPSGWTKAKGDGFLYFVSPDKKAVLAFDSYKSGTDPGASIMKLASKLKLTDLDWKGGQKELKIGKDQLAGRGAKGTCSYDGKPSTYSYATVNAGDTEDMLIIYAVQKDAAPEHKKEAKEALQSLQKGS